jgi:hypothetical protein
MNISETAAVLYSEAYGLDLLNDQLTVIKKTAKPKAQNNK